MFLPLPSVLDPVRKQAVVPVRWINFVLLLGVFIVNILATTLPLNGKQTGAISDMYPTYITPAGYAFTIWGIIYFALASWGIYQVLPRSHEDASQNQAVGYLFIVNALANMGWIVAWHYFQMWLALLLMLIILATLAMIYYRLSEYDPSESYSQWFLVQFPFSVYLGWIVAASIVNLFAATTNLDEKYIVPGVVGIVLGFLLEGYIGLVRMDPVVPGVGCWAILAIGVRFSQAGGPVAITGTAFTLGALLGVEVVVLTVFNYVWIRNGHRISWKEQRAIAPAVEVPKSP